MDELDSRNHFFRRHGIRLLLCLFLILGVLGVIVFEHGGPYPFRFGEHIFMALSVAAIIGLAIDLTLQQQIVANVFEAAIGYLLPEELRSELRWIYNLPTICVQHVQTVKLERIDGTDLIRYRSNVTRCFKNLTDKEVPFGIGVGTDEWFHPGHSSRIVSMSYQIDGESDTGNIAPAHVQKRSDGIETKTVTVMLGTGKRITTSFEIEEIRRENDWAFITFGTPTANSTVIIDAPSDLVARVDFDHRMKEELTRKGDNTWQLNGTLLPHQTIRIKWYRKDQSEAWMANTVS